MRRPCPQCKKFFYGTELFCHECGCQLRPRPVDVQQRITLTLEQIACGETIPIEIDLDGRKETIFLKIPSNVKNGSRIRIKGKGRLIDELRGDLHLIVEVKPQSSQGDQIASNPI